MFGMTSDQVMGIVRQIVPISRHAGHIVRMALRKSGHGGRGNRLSGCWAGASACRSRLVADCE